MTKEYNTLHLIGRFQGFHLGHKAVCDLALEKAEQLVISIGSSNRHRSTKNPWKFAERAAMIRSIYKDRVTILSLNDFDYNDDAWLAAMHHNIDVYSEGRCGLIGFNKDSSSRYIKMFPTLEVEEIPSQFGTLNATQIRDSYFQDLPQISQFIPEELHKTLRDFAFTEEFKWLLKEYKYVREYKKAWSNTPYPPIFQTVDNVVIQAGHILLVTRREPPFAGALALPGGFLNPNETLLSAAIREMKEETRIADNKGELPPSMIASFVKGSRRFDDPERSDRGRTITEAFLFKLPEKDSLYKVRGDDDATHAQWYELASLKEEDFMEDHASIISEMTGVKLK